MVIYVCRWIHCSLPRMILFWPGLYKQIEWVVDETNYSTLSRRRTTSKKTSTKIYQPSSLLFITNEQQPKLKGCKHYLRYRNEFIFSSWQPPAPFPIYQTCINIYRPGSWPLCIMAAFCSWKRSPSRAELLRYLSTQRRTQPSSREIKDFVVKSLTQSSKQRCTRREYIYIM